MRDLKNEWGSAVETIARITREGEKTMLTNVHEHRKTNPDFAAWLSEPKPTGPLQELAHDSSWTESMFSYVLQIYKPFPGDKAPRLSELIFSCPWMFWQPPLRLQRSWVASTALKSSKADKGLDSAHLSLLSRAFDPVNGFQNWDEFLSGPSELNPFQWALSQSDSSTVDGLTRAKQLSQCHDMMRLVLTGKANPRPNFKILVKTVGVEECRARLSLVEGLFDELRVGGEALARTWIEEGEEALLGNPDDRTDVNPTVEVTSEEKAKP